MLPGAGGCELIPRISLERVDAEKARRPSKDGYLFTGVVTRHLLHFFFCLGPFRFAVFVVPISLAAFEFTFCIVGRNVRRGSLYSTTASSLTGGPLRISKGPGSLSIA